MTVQSGACLLSVISEVVAAAVTVATAVAVAAAVAAATAALYKPRPLGRLGPVGAINETVLSHPFFLSRCNARRLTGSSIKDLVDK